MKSNHKIRGLKGTGAVLKKELMQYFNSFLIYGVDAAFLLVFGIIASIIAIGARYGDPSLLMPNTAVLLLFITPFMTMRLMATEKRLGTDELLFTSPLGDWGIVLGKFLGALIAYLFIILSLLIYFALIYAVSSFHIPVLIAGLIGLILLSSAYISIGLFASTSTSNQFIAAGLTFAILLAFWVIDLLAKMFKYPFSEYVRYLSLLNHFERFSRGIISSADVIYFLSVTFFFLYLSYKNIAMREWKLR